MSSAAIEHAYRYAFASDVVKNAEGDRLQLATSGGRAEFPYFFQGQLKQAIGFDAAVLHQLNVFAIAMVVITRDAAVGAVGCDEIRPLI